ncbi:MAG: maleylpyruvate isomerase family mycothiol-dependent enzyme [Acidimicrobiia bacterium]
MDKREVWPTIHAERRALADDLGSIDDGAWDLPSPCAGWSVRDVLAHMTATARMTPPAFVARMARSGFKLSAMQARDIAAARAGTAADGLRRFEAAIGSTRHPPGPIDTWLGETIVHADDIRRTLGIAHDYPAAALARVAESYAGSNLVIGAKDRIAGLELVATDTGWTRGAGARVAGPMVSLLSAMTGRTPPLADLEGDGVALLVSRR